MYSSCIRNLFCFLILVVLYACSSRPGTDSWIRIQQTGKVLIGTDATYMPFESKNTDTDKLVGFDIDLMNEICRRIKISPEYLVIPFDSIISGLKEKKYDLIISAMTITEERAKEVKFSLPYYLAGQSIVVNEQNNRIKSIEDLKGKRIGVQLGTTGEMEAKKVEKAEVVSYDDINAAFADLSNEKNDAIINDMPTNKAIIKIKGKMKIVGQALTNEQYGIAGRPEDKRLMEAVDKALSEMKKDGTVKNLEKKWGI